MFKNHQDGERCASMDMKFDFEGEGIKDTFKAGKIIGFGCSLTIFVTVFYFLASVLDKVPPFVQYWHVITVSFLVYVTGLFLWRKKWL